MVEGLLLEQTMLIVQVIAQVTSKHCSLSRLHSHHETHLHHSFLQTLQSSPFIFLSVSIQPSPRLRIVGPH